MKASVMTDSCTFDAPNLLVEPFVGAGHARDQVVRGHGPLLRVPGQKFFGQASTAIFRMMAVLFAGLNGE